MLIPRVIHYIWLGSKPMAPLMDQWRAKWAELHPRWQIKVWREIPEVTAIPIPRLAYGGEVLESRLPDYLKRCPTIAKRSDVWRYDLLERLGGVYLDTDFDPLKDIEPIINDKTAFAGRCITKYDWSKNNPSGKLKTEIGCSIIGATPHHPWLRELFGNIEEQDPVAPLSLAFPYITEITTRHSDVHLFNTEVFYSVRWDEYDHRQSHYIKTPPSEAYAVHRWSSLWFSNGLKTLLQPNQTKNQEIDDHPK